jgi:hypothetical protein
MPEYQIGYEIRENTYEVGNVWEIIEWFKIDSSK